MDTLSNYLMPTTDLTPRDLRLFLEGKNLNVNTLYGDPLSLLLTSVRDTLLTVREELVEVNTSETRLIFSQPQVIYNPKSLPPSLSNGCSYYQADALLLGSNQLENFFLKTRDYLQILYDHGLNAVDYQTMAKGDADRYLSIPLQLFLRSDSTRIRSFALYLMAELVALGIDLYSDIIFDTLHQLVRDGASKSTENPLSPELNYQRTTALLTQMLQLGFQINYQRVKPTTFAEEFGIVSSEDEDTITLQPVRYTMLSVLALCAIYDRVDILTWVLNFTGPLPLNGEIDLHDSIGQRQLAIDSPSLSINDEDAIKDDDKFMSFVLTWDNNPSEDASCDLLEIVEDQPSQVFTPMELAERHQSLASLDVLRRYQRRLENDWLAYDPTVSNVDQLVYS